MKKTLLSLATILILGSANSQITVEESRTKAIEVIEAGELEQESYDAMHGVLVGRLSETAADTYQSGAAEISFDEFIARLEFNTSEQVFNSANGDFTMVNEPSIALLNDGFSTPPPTKMEDEKVLDYVNRLSELVAQQPDGYHDYLLMATTGGELGIVYTRVTAAEGSANAIEETSTSASFNIFPNPVSDQITITGLPLGNFPGQIIDAQGKKVMEVSIVDGKQLDLGTLSAGFYTMSILVEGNAITEKIQVRK